jgi:hypothetical protein
MCPRSFNRSTRRVFVSEILGISRSSAFQAANNGQLPVIRIGKRLLVSLHSLEQILGGSVDVGPSESSQ